MGDRYPERSIKNAERSRRAEKGVQRIHIFGAEQPVPKQWKKFLSCGESKESLMVFLSEHWRTYKTCQLNGILNVFITSKETCRWLSPGSTDDDVLECHDCADLESNHEEADTRLLLHAKHAANTYDSVIIRSPDTDVFILCVAMQPTLAPKKLFFTTGTGTRYRTINVNDVVNVLGEQLSHCLPGFHAYSGKGHNVQYKITVSSSIRFYLF